MSLQNKILIFIFIFFIFSTEQCFSQSDVKSIIAKFSDEDPWVNGEAINELVKTGELAVDDLIISLQDKNENVRWCSAIALEKISPLGKQSIPFLISALKDNNSNVRWCSALALGKFESDAIQSIPSLQKLLYDEDYDLRWAAYIAISKIDKTSLNIIPNLSEKISAIEIFTSELMDELNVPGISISIIQNNKIDYSNSFGIADANTKILVDAKTMFEACSMSKPVFAYLVLKLVELGKLELDKTLYNYLPEKFICDDEEYPKQITARMILSHTSGLPNWRKGSEENESPLPIYFKPGTKFNYSGEGIFYLQRVVEKITNQSLEDYAKENLFDKLGLTSTSFVWKEYYDKQIATGHNAEGNCNERKKYIHSNAAFTLYTTANEYAKLIIEIMRPGDQNDHSLSDSMINEMLTHQVRVDTREVIDRPGRNYGLFSFRGLGWAIDSTITGDVVYHSGANQTGFRCYSQFSPKDESGIVIMTNCENGNELWRRLIKEIGDL
ncbi:MAG: serine hydrolase [Ignavibacterium sp.]|jgi:CubicO group peptidase (beta-lactamase class C family)|nr:serine hydrolase [Ignavibacterium sp.]